MYKLLRRNFMLISRGVGQHENSCVPLQQIITKQYIRNTENPSCVNCVNFIPDQTCYPFDTLPDDNFGKCKKFGELNLVTGGIEYDMALNCRRDETKCGSKGIEYHRK